VPARYPFHLYALQDAGAASYFTDCALRDSFFRAFTAHYTNNTLVERNVAFNVSGFTFYLEDGVEESNAFNYNFAGQARVLNR
jgi:hypothetical protein